MAKTITTVLVCGGAGYIGSHMVRMLAENGYCPIVLDDFSTGHKEAVQGYPIVEANLMDSRALGEVFTAHKVDAVMHFAGKILVGESVQQPALYYENNVTGTMNLLEGMRRANINRFVFSSTAAVYGIPNQDRIAEDHLLSPVNPYGFTKLHVEHILADYGTAYGMQSVCLRYFNASGAHPDGSMGESHSPESHLIPNMLLAILGRAPHLTIFGEDYDTPDGTCIRDYIHVQDLSRAHLLALENLAALDEPGKKAFNLGNGTGFSVREVVDAAEKVTGQKVPYTMGPRRPGDPARLVADSARAREELGWTPQHPELEYIIETAWNWHRNQRY